MSKVYRLLTLRMLKPEDSMLHWKLFRSNEDVPHLSADRRRAMFYPSAGKDFFFPLLVGLPYCTDNILATLQRQRTHVRFLLDSGAFTAFMAGRPIDLNAYERFVKTLLDSGADVWRYFTLDVIGDAAATRRNYDTLRARGLTPVPIFTRGENVRVLDDYYATSDVVAIGGLVGTNDPKGFVNGVMRHVGNRKVHLLGFTPRPFLKTYRPYMCDSSSYTETARWGWLNVYLGNGVWYPTLARKAFTSPLPRRLVRGLRSYGINPSDLARDAAWHGSGASRTVSIMSWARWQIDVQEFLNVRLFFAVGSTDHIDQFVQHHLYWKEQRCLAS